MSMPIYLINVHTGAPFGRVLLHTQNLPQKGRPFIMRRLTCSLPHCAAVSIPARPGVALPHPARMLYDRSCHWEVKVTDRAASKWQEPCAREAWTRRHLCTSFGSRNSFLGRRDRGAQFALLVFAVQGHHGSAYPGMRG